MGCSASANKRRASERRGSDESWVIRNQEKASRTDSPEPQDFWEGVKNIQDDDECSSDHSDSLVSERCCQMSSLRTTTVKTMKIPRGTPRKAKQILGAKFSSVSVNSDIKVILLQRRTVKGKSYLWIAELLYNRSKYRDSIVFSEVDVWGKSRGK